MQTRNVTYIVRRFFLACSLLTLVLSSLSLVSTAAGQPVNPLRIRKSVIGGLTTVETGQMFQYRITASCNNLTTDCGDLTLTDTLPAGLTLLDVSGPLEVLPATTAAIGFVSDTSGLPTTLVIRNKRAAEPGARPFADGEIVEFLITVRVNLNATPGTLSNNLTGDVTRVDGGGDPPAIVVPPVDVTLTPPVPPAADGSDWTYAKTQVIPVAPQQPTTNQPTLYQISVCPARRTGVLPYTDLQLIDTYPNGATILDNGGGTPTPPNQIIWNIPDAQVAAALESGNCITREIVLQYNTPPFTVPTFGLVNTLRVDANECTTDCGGASVSFDLVAPDIDVQATKISSGSPVGQGGVGRFFLNVDPNDGNVPAPDVELVDDINQNQIRVTRIESGSWSVLDPLVPFVSVRATVQVTDDLGAVTTVGPYDGSVNTVIPTLPVPPRRVSEVRWIFAYDPDGAGAQPFQPGLPLGFQMDEQPEIVYTPLTNPPFPTAYTPGIYQNCARASFTGGTGFDQDCIPYELGNPGVTGVTIDALKTSPSGENEFLPYQEFPLVLRLRLSERAGAGDQIVNPTMIDTLPPELEFVSWDAVTFDNVPGGPHPMPFFRQVGTTLQWYWAAAPLAGSEEAAPVGLPGTVPASGSSAFTMTANGTDQDVTVRFTVRIAPNVAPNPVPAPPYSNTGYLIGPSDPICENGTLGTETSFGIDDGDGANEKVCRTGFDFRVRRALALQGFKWIRNPNYTPAPPRFPEFAVHTDEQVPYDTTDANSGANCANPNNRFEYPVGSGNFWVRFPCVAFGFPENPVPVGGGPFVAIAPNDDQFEYLLDIRNAGNVTGEDYYLYDVLPRIGDTGSGGPLSGSPRFSQFSTYLTGPVIIDALTGVTGPTPIVEYSVATEPCRPEVFDDPAQGGCTDDWASWATVAATPRAITAYRIRFVADVPAVPPSGGNPGSPAVPGTRIAVGGRMLFRVPMVIATTATYGDEQIAWNSFAHTAVNSENTTDGFLPPAEPRKVGIRVPERLSIGNRVWRDSDNSGTINAPDDLNPGIAGVTVNLYADFNGDGVADGAPIASELTDTNGYYLFDDLFPNDTAVNANANTYIIGIPSSNFDPDPDGAGPLTTGPLFNLRSSTGLPPTPIYTSPPETNADRVDHGRDPATPGLEVFSSSIPLMLYNEPLGEVASGNFRDGAFFRGTRGETDANSDLTVDFGFFGGSDVRFSLGNRVFRDDGNDGAGGFNAALRDNGIQDSTELGVNGVRIDLYRDGNANGRPDTDEFIRFDVTEAGAAGAGRPGADLNGYYLFDGLDAGTYFVVLPGQNFGATPFDPDGAGTRYTAVVPPLGGWHSSSFNGTEIVGAAGAVGTPATDLDDNGVAPASRRPDLDGVASVPVVFIRTVAEVTGETDLSLQFDPDGNAGTPNLGVDPAEYDGPGSIGRYGETDADSNVAIDFGFTPPMSIGNRVWLDDTNDPAQWALGGSRNNALIDATDDGNLVTAGVQNPGIAGVDLQLFLDANGDGDFSDTNVAGFNETLVFRTTTSGANGYYLFDGLAPGNYIVRIPASEFGGGQPLSGLISSFDATAQPALTNQTDSNDNGVDDTNPAANGITSTRIALVYLTEATAEADPTPQTATDRGRFGEDDDDSDLTIDFGFVRPPMSIGNQVWLDDHPTNAALRNNGIFNAGEIVLTGVEIALYRDLDVDGVVDAGEDTGLRDTTDANGFYLFNNLPPGDYIVAVTEDNFTAGGTFSVLENMISSRSVAPNPTPADNDVDNNDNGIDTAVAGVGIISSRINLSYGAEATAETPVNDPVDGVGGRGTLGERNNDSNLTVDFGFYVPMSLGNRVWLDDTDTVANWTTTRDNALLNVGTDDLDNPNIAGVQGLGVAGVTLRLYRDLDADGVIDAGEDTGRTTTTNATGYYVFDGLPRGTYMVAVEASNFTAGAPLAGFYSSRNLVPPSDNNTDNTDDGSGSVANPRVPDAGFGVLSPSIVLSYTSTATGDEPVAGAGANDESDPTPQTQTDRGTNGERDTFSNLTLDFGFARPTMSLGNRVWYDGDDTATINAGDDFDTATAGDQPGIPGVVVRLYRDSNADGTPDDIGVIGDFTDDAIASDTTDANGYYLFDPVPAGRYVVAVDPTNFAAGAVLEETRGSTSGAPNPAAADDQIDNNDNGRDAVNASYGVLSSSINLVAGAEATGENVSGNAADGPAGFGTNGQTDSDSELTVDFGFFKPMSIGNRVWFDDGAGTAANRNNGLLDTGEIGIAGVRVALYRDDGDGVFDAGDTFLRFDTTDTTGYYLFDNLLPGTYLVHLPADNFGDVGVGDTVPGDPLLGRQNSVPTGTDSVAVAGNPFGTDRDDNGINNTRPDVNGIASGLIILTRDSEPTGEQVSTDTSTTAGDNPTAGDGPNGRGRTGESDDNSALTVDFGFIPPLSLGNRVWLDNGLVGATTDLTQYNDGLQNGSEPGVDGVIVNLDYDINNDGDFADTIGGVAETDYRTTTTANGGYYLFDGLREGRYRTRIVAANFAGAGALVNLISSSDNNQTTPPAEDAEDRDDNGIDSATYLADGVLSSEFTLSYDLEPTSDADVPTPAVLASYGPNGFGRSGEIDADSNLTLDFGVIAPPRSLGNRLWLDDGVGGGTRNNGILDGAEPAVPVGVRVSLYQDADGDGLPDDLGAVGVTDDALRFDLTNADGYYLFDNLPPGQYLVGVDQSNFATGGLLVEYTSSTGSVDNAVSNLDNRDNGIDRASPQNLTASPYGILTTSSDLRANPLLGLPTGETGSGDTSTATGNNPTAGDGPQSRGRFGETDASSDLTLDFGFVKTLSLGNRIWRDDGAGGGTINNGIRDGGEAGIDGVVVELYADTDADGVPDGAALATNTTSGGGYYLFSGLAPGSYLVVVPASNFAVGQPLAGLYSSVPTGSENIGVVGNPNTPATDRDDNGVDTLDPLVNGVRSGTIVLALDSEPTGETELSARSADGPDSRGTNNESDDNSNLTVDFGFIPPLSLGNRVWLDDGATAGAPLLAQYDDGLINGTEPGIAGVVLTLFRDNNGDGDFADAGENIRTTSTDADGYYLFDNLPPGDYRVRVDATNFAAAAPLDFLASSTGNSVDTTIDSNDNGIDNASPATNGIVGNPLTLTYNTQPTGETDIAPNTAGNVTAYGADRRGRFGEEDDDSNLTIDFGFRPIYSLGNRVWYDTNNSGDIDGAEVGINGVTVELYTADANGDPTGAALATQTTSGGGYYRFDTLRAGSYVVIIPASNFGGAGALFGTRSSDGAAEEADPNTNGDSNDNGVDAPPASAVRSNQVTLGASGVEPTGEIDLAASGQGTRDAYANMTLDFGFTSRLSLGNRIWRDTNDDGLLSVGETGLDGVSVRLLTSGGNDVDSDLAMPGVQPTLTTTANGGYYRFDGLTPGDYLVQIDASNFTGSGTLVGLNSSSVDEVNPNTSGESNDNGLGANPDPTNGIRSAVVTLTTTGEPISETDLTASDPAEPDTFTNLTVDFGFAPYSLGNRTWFDLNSNGVIDAGEVGIDGVTVELYAADVSGNPTGVALATQTTAAGGYYRFDNLRAGDYVVVIPAANFSGAGVLVSYQSTTPDETTPNTDGDNNDNGLGTAQNPTTGVRSGVVTLGPNGGEPTGELDLAASGEGTTSARANMTVDFGFVREYSLGNRVWIDTNTNSLFDAGEAGVGTITVELYRDVDGSGTFSPADTLVTSTTTSAQGYYQFTDLVAGDYLAVLPTTNFDAAGDPLFGYLSSGTSRTVAGALSETAAPLANADTDNDDNGTTTGTLGSPGGLVTSSVITIGPGTSEPTGETDRTSGLTDDTPDDRSNTTVDFGFIALVHVGNLIWEDTTNNGRVDAGEPPLAGVTVTLLRADGTPATAADGSPVAPQITGIDGRYLFINLAPGDYCVQLTPPAGYSSSTGTPGTNLDPNGPFEPGVTPNNDTDNDDNGSAASGSISSSIVSLSVGGEPTTDGDSDNNTNLTVDLGLFRPASVGSVVWFDFNGNGVRDAGEAGVAGVTVTLLDSSGTPLPGADGQPVTTTTDANGQYLFTNLPPGDYAVGFSTLPAGYTFTQPNSGSDAADSDVDPASGRTGEVNLGAGAANLTLWAGLVNPTAINLARFVAVWEDGQVRVRWTTLAESRTFGYRIYRSTGERSAASEVTSALIAVQGTGEYSWTDSSAAAGTAYSYWLIEVETDGRTNEYGPARTGISPANQPNRIYVPLALR